MTMSTITRAIAVMTVTLAVPAWAQHEGHGATGAAAGGANPQQLAACVQSQQQAMALVDAGNRRLEAARQTNEPAALRAAMDDFQATLSAVKAQLTPCADVAAAAPVADAHAAHTMPSAPAAAPATADSSTDGALDIVVRTTPSPARSAAENQFEVMVKDRQGRPVDGADVSLVLVMPAMPAMKMPEMRHPVALKGAGNGRYTGAGQIMMAGTWTLTVSVKQNGKEVGQQKTTLTAR